MGKTKVLKIFSQASKKFFAVLISLAMILLLVPGMQHKAHADSGDTVVTIGAGTKYSYYAPYANYYKYGMSQSIYKASEINQAGIIKSIAFNVGSAATMNTESVKIYIGTTSKNTFSSYKDYFSESDLTLVYSGSPQLGTAKGWEALQLTNPYTYDASENLVIGVCGRMSKYSKTMYVYSSVTDSSIRAYSDTVSSAGTFAPTVTTTNLSANRPDVQLTFEASNAPFPVISSESAAMQVGNTAKLTVDASKNALGKAIDSSKITIQSYQWKYSLNGADAVNVGDAVSTSATSNALDFAIPSSAKVGDEYDFTCDVSFTEDGETKTATTKASYKVIVVSATPAAVPSNVVVTPSATTVVQGASAITATASCDIADTGKGTISYQWYTCDKDGSNATAIDGATNETLSISAAAEVGINYYACEVINTFEKVKVGKATSKPVGITTKGVEISTAQEFVNFATAVNNGTNYAGKSVVLTKDIDMSEVASFEPIGTSSSKAFKGTFDGKGHAIKNLTINSSNKYVGLFGYVDTGARISNVKLVNANVNSTSTTSSSATGALVAYINSATVSNSGAEGTVSSVVGYTGGLVGDIEGEATNKGYIKTSYFSGSVTQSGSGYTTAHAGGLAGYEAHGEISDSYSTGTVSNTSTATAYTAGLLGYAGYTDSYLYNCFTTAAPTGKATAALCYLKSSAVTLCSAEKPCYYLEGIATNPTGAQSTKTGTVISKTAAEIANADFVTLLNSKAAAENTFVAGPDGCPVLKWNATDDPVVAISPASFSETQVAGSEIDFTADASKNSQGKKSSAALTNYKWTYSIAGADAVEIASGATTTSCKFKVPDAAVGKELKVACEVSYTLDGATAAASSDVAMKVVSSTPASLPTDLAVTPTTSIATQGTTGVALTCSYSAVQPGWGTPSFQWYTCDKDGSNAVAIEDATSESYTAAPQYTLGDSYYKCAIVNTFETYKVTEPVYSPVATVTTNGLEISTAADLIAFANLVNAGNDFEGCTVSLANDIDLGGVNFSPIGSGFDNPFNGVFDGKGHKISNYTINSTTSPAAFFGYVKGSTLAQAGIKNLVLEGDVTYSGDATSAIVGGVAGMVNIGSSAQGFVIENVSFNGKLTCGGGMAGGIVGTLSGISGMCSIKACSANVDIAASGSGMSNVGGIAGMASGVDIADCYVNITGTNNVSSANTSVAGLVSTQASRSTTISNCIAVGNVVVADGIPVYGISASASVTLNPDKPSYYLSTLATGVTDKAGATAKSEDELKSEELVSALDANGSNTAEGTHTWIQPSAADYPQLWWQVDTSLMRAKLTATYPSTENNYVHAGDTLSMSIDTSKTVVGEASTATDLSFVWYKQDATAGTDAVQIAGNGATNTYTFTSSDIAGHDYKFYAVVTYKLGDAQHVTQSNPAKVLMLSSINAAVPTEVTVEGPAEVEYSKSISLSGKYTIADTGKGNITTKWYSCDENGENAKELTAAEDGSLKLTGKALGTDYYYYEVTNTFEQVKVATVKSEIFAVETTNLTISSPQELLDFANAVNAGTSFDGLTVELTDNINMKGVDMIPIGKTPAYAFKGTFEGNGYVISNLTINNDDLAYIGLFGYIDSGAVKNLVVRKATINAAFTSVSYTGGIAAYVRGAAGNTALENVGFEGSVTAKKGNIGGLVGYITSGGTSYVKTCYAKANVTSTSSTTGSVYTGGFAGYATSVVISDSYANCAVVNNAKTSSYYSHDYAGSFIGYVSGAAVKANNCYALGTVSAAKTGEDYGFGFWSSSSYASKAFNTDTPCYYLKANGTAATNGTVAETLLVPLDSVDAADLVSKLNAATGEDTFKVDEAGNPVLSWQASIIDESVIQAAEDLTYSGAEQVGVTTSDSSVTLSGTVKATEAGTYTAIAKLPAGKTWDDGSTANKEITWSIAKATLTATYAGETIPANGTPALKVDVTGFVGGETATTATDYIAPWVTTSTISGGIKSGEVYNLTPKGGYAKNYEFKYVAGDLVVDISAVKAKTATTVEGYATDAMATINALANLSADDIATYKTAIDGYVTSAKAYIETAKTIDEINEAKDEAYKNIKDATDDAISTDGMALDTLKTNASVAVTNEATNVKTAISALTELDSAAKTTYISDIDNAVEEAKAAINDAKTSATIKLAKTNGIDAINKILTNAKAADVQALADAKTTATAAINTAAANAATSITGVAGLTDTEKANYKADVEKAATTARKAIESATTITAVSSAQTSGEKAIAELVTTAQAKAPKNLTGAKAAAKSELASQLENATKTVKALEGLTQDQINGVVTNMNKAVASANAEIDSATSTAEVDSAKQVASSAVATAVKKAQTNSENAKALNDAIAAAKNEINLTWNESRLSIIYMTYTDDDTRFDAIDELEKVGNAALSKLGRTYDVDQIATDKAAAVKDLKAIVDKVDAANKDAQASQIADATAAIDKAVDEAKAGLDALGEISSTQRAEYKASVDKAADEAEAAVKAAESKSAITKAKEAGIESVEAVTAEAKAADAKILTDAKADAKASIEAQLKDDVAAVEALDDMTAKQIAAAKATMNKAAEDAYAAIDAAATTKDVAAAKDAAITKIAAAKADAQAASEKAPYLAGKTITSGNFVYTVLADRATVSVKALSSAKANIKTVKIASTVKDAKGNVYKVTEIAAKAFKGCTNLTKVSGGANLVKIGDKAFSKCSKLKTVSCSSKTLSTIGSNAFYKTVKLTKITIKSTTKLATVTHAFKKAGKKAGVKLTVKVAKAKKAAYSKLILKKGENKKLTVK